MSHDNGANYTLNLLNDFSSDRFGYSLQIGDYFFNGPFAGVLVAPAAFTFVYHFMSNNSEECPEGYLNGNVLMSFFSVAKNEDGSLTHTPGHGKIPNNHYKRAVGDEYSIPFLQVDTLKAAVKYPKVLSVGGNLGKPNSFVGIALEDLTGSVFNATSLTEGNNLACFAM